jgi:hypothetical protein
MLIYNGQEITITKNDVRCVEGDGGKSTGGLMSRVFQHLCPYTILVSAEVARSWG